MINLRVLSAAAAMALVLPLVVPTESFAQDKGGGGGRGGGAAMGGGGGFRGGGAPAAIGGGGGFRGGGAPNMAGGAGFRSGGAAMGGGARFADKVPNSGVAVGGPRYAGSNWQGGNWQGGYRRHRGGGFWPGVAVGAAIGGSYAYYGSPGYYDQGYYDDSYYYDESAPVAAVPAEGGDDSYCSQTYRSYDPASGTYLGYDGQRHPCP